MKLRELADLMDRLGGAAQKRNHIVHGRWLLEVTLWVHKGVVRYNSQFLRQYDPIDQTIGGKLANFKNQKERVKYCFTLRRIAAAAADADALSSSIGKFMAAM